MLINLVYFIGGMFSMILFIGIGRDLLIKGASKFELIAELLVILFNITLGFVCGVWGVVILVIYIYSLKDDSPSMSELLEAFNILPELKNLLIK